ncbi:MAG: tellurite resistance TerB family protein [Methylovirgula sp.]
MFDRLKSFMSDLAGAPAQREFGADDYRLAAVSLLVHLAGADGVIDAAECEKLRAIITQDFGLDAQATTRLIKTAEASDREAVDFYHFTNTIKRSLDAEGRQKIVAMMWEIALADGMVHELEENIVARIAELLGVSPHDRVRLRHEAAAERAREPAYEGPWAQRFAEQKG